MASFLGRQFRRVKNWTTKNSGALARGAVVATAGAAGSLLGPAGAVGAAALADAAVGGVVERNVRRGSDRAVSAIEEYFDDPEGKPTPPQLVTELVGVPSEFRLPGASLWNPEAQQQRLEAQEDQKRQTTRRLALAIGGGGVALATAVAVALRRR